MAERETLTFRDKVERVVITSGVFIILSSLLILGVWFFSPSGALFSGKVMFMVFVIMVSVGIVMVLVPSLLDKNDASDSF